jgi:hypothetical protein
VSVTPTLDAAIKVSVSPGAGPAINASVSSGIGPAIVVTDSATAVIGVAGVSPFVAGDNISITPVDGSLVFSSPYPPVLSVQGRTGNVVLSAVDLTAAVAVHTHSTSQVSGLPAACLWPALVFGG